MSNPKVSDRTLDQLVYENDEFNFHCDPPAVSEYLKERFIKTAVAAKGTLFKKIRSMIEDMTM